MKPLLLCCLSVFIAYGAIARGGKKKIIYDTWNEGNVHVYYSIPFMNQYYFRPPVADMAGGGFLGISAGSDYCYRKNRFISAQAGVAIDHMVPFPVGVDRFPDSNGYLHVETMNAAFINLRIIMHGNGLTLDMGLCLVSIPGCKRIVTAIV